MSTRRFGLGFVIQMVDFHPCPSGPTDSPSSSRTAMDLES